MRWLYERTYTVTVLTISVIIVLAGDIARRAHASIKAQPPRIVADWEGYATREGTPSPAPDSVMRVVVFFDYFCPASSYVWTQLQAFRERHGEASLNVSWRHLPSGRISREVAAAAECARTVGRFGAMHRHLMSELEQARSQPLPLVAAAAGIADTATFKDCLRDTTTAAAIDADVRDGRALQGRGTPLVLLDSLLFFGGPSTEYLAAYARARGEGARR